MKVQLDWVNAYKCWKVMTSDGSFPVISYTTLTKMRTHHQLRDVISTSHV